MSIIDNSEDNISYSVYIPDNMTSDTKIHLYFMGQGGSNDGIKAVVSDNNTESVVITINKLPSKINNNNDEPKILKILQNVASELNLNASTFSVSGVSNGGDIAIKVAAESYIGDYGLKAESVSKFGSSPWTSISSSLKILAQNNVPLISGDPNCNDHKYGGICFNITKLLGEHDDLCMYMYKENFIDFINGYKELSSEINGKFWDSNGEEIKLSDWQKCVLEYINSMSINSGIDNSYYNSSLYFNLSHLNNVENCNFAFINENVNIIRNKIKTSNFLTQNINISSDSTSNVPSKEKELLYKIYDKIAELYEKLAKDTRSIATIGNMYNNLDNFYKYLAEKIEKNNVETITDGNMNTQPSTNAYIDEYNSLITNDNQVVYQYSDNCKLVINIENDKVTAVEHYYLFDTAEEALNSNVRSYYENQGFIDEILIDGSSVKVIFKSDIVNGMSKEEITKFYCSKEIVE